MKIVLNKCFGGYLLSYKAMMEIAKRKNITLYAYGKEDIISDVYVKIKEFNRNYDEYYIAYSVKDYGDKIKCDEIRKSDLIETKPLWLDKESIYMPWGRCDPDVIDVVQRLGSESGGPFSDLRIVEIPDDIIWEVEYYDGIETICEVHRRW